MGGWYSTVIDADPAFEARAKATYMAVLRTGHDYVLPLRWVDVIGHLAGPSLTEAGRAERRLGEWCARNLWQDAGMEYKTTPETRQAVRERVKVHIERTRQADGDPVKRRALREAEKAALRTPKQREAHEEYLAQKARRSGS